MTNEIPFEDIKRDVAIITCVIQGSLPSITNDARFSPILELCSLMSRCWSIVPNNRPTATECETSIRWMVSNVGFQTQTHLTRYGFTADGCSVHAPTNGHKGVEGSVS